MDYLYLFALNCMKRILFIEDESALQKTMADILKQENYEVFSALDGENGLKMASALPDGQQPDLILLDLILPKMHGFDVLQKLKTDENTKEIPVIVLTNLERLEDIEKALKLGAFTYLVKANYKLEEVLNKIKQALAG